MVRIKVPVVSEKAKKLKTNFVSKSVGSAETVSLILSLLPERHTDVELMKRSRGEGKSDNTAGS